MGLTELRSPRSLPRAAVAQLQERRAGHLGVEQDVLGTAHQAFIVDGLRDIVEKARRTGCRVEDEDRADGRFRSTAGADPFRQGPDRADRPASLPRQVTLPLLSVSCLTRLQLQKPRLPAIARRRQAWGDLKPQFHLGTAHAGIRPLSRRFRAFAGSGASAKDHNNRPE